MKTYKAVYTENNNNDILICVNDNLYGFTNDKLIVGEKYTKLSSFEMAEKTIVQVKGPNGDIDLYDDRHFIPIDVWREFKLKQIGL